MKVSERLTLMDLNSETKPIYSALTSVVDVLVKFGLLFVKRKTINKNVYLKHIDDKSLLRCAALCVPVLGNIGVYVYDKLKVGNIQIDWKNINDVMRALQNKVEVDDILADENSYKPVQNLSPLFKQYPLLLRMAMKQNPEILKYADPETQKKYVMKDPKNLQYALTAQGNVECVWKVVQTRPDLLSLANHNVYPKILEKKGVLLEYLPGHAKTESNVDIAVKENPSSLKYAPRGEQLRVVKESEKLEMFRYANSTYKDELAKTLLEEDGMRLEHLRTYQDNPGYVQIATSNKKNALEFASVEVKLQRLREDGKEFQYIGEDSKEEMDYARAALTNTEEAFEYLPKSLKKNGELLEIAKETEKRRKK